MASLEDNSPNDTANSGDSFFDTLKKAAQNLVNLQIVTIVGDAQIEGSIQKLKVDLSVVSGSDNTAIVTNINLIESDITSVIPKKFEDQFDNPIMKYHTSQVELASTTMDQKVKMIGSLLNEISPLLKNES